MQQPETSSRLKKKYFAIMLVCLLYGGFAIMFVAFQAYTNVWRIETSPFFGQPRFMDNNRPFMDENRPAGDANFPAAGQRNPISPLESITSPTSIMLLVGGIIALIAGLSIWQIIREREIKSIKAEMADNLLMPDEKKIIEVLRRSNSEATQSMLAKETGMNKVQIHRSIKRLEAKGIVEKHDYGMTNKIILKKELL